MSAVGRSPLTAPTTPTATQDIDPDPDSCAEGELAEAIDRAREQELRSLYFVADRSSKIKTYQQQQYQQRREARATLSHGREQGRAPPMPFVPSVEERQVRAMLDLLPPCTEVFRVQLDGGERPRGGGTPPEDLSAPPPSPPMDAEARWQRADDEASRRSCARGEGAQDATPDSMVAMLLREELDQGPDSNAEEFSKKVRNIMDAMGGTDFAAEGIAVGLQDAMGEMLPPLPTVSAAAASLVADAASLTATTTTTTITIDPGQPSGEAGTRRKLPASGGKKPSSQPSAGQTGGPGSGGSGTNGNNEDGVTHIELEKFGPWTGNNSAGRKAPQQLVWQYLCQRSGPEGAEREMPWWTRCSFRRAVRPWLCPTDPAVKEGRYFWMPDPLVADMPAELLEHYSIYATLISRVHWLQMLYEREERGGTMPREVRLQLALWLDSHHMLMLWMEETGYYRNCEVLEPVEDCDPDPFVENRAAETLPGRRTAPSPTWFDLYCPSLRLVMHQGELPDLTCLLPIIRYWEDVPRDLLYSFEEDLRQFADLFSKANPRPQQSRSMNNICARNVLQYPRIAECFRRMVFCTLGGLYDFPGCGTVVAHFFVRHELYRWFCMHPASDEGLGTWFNGFVLDEIKDLISNHGKKKRKKKDRSRADDDPDLDELMFDADDLVGGPTQESSAAPGSSDQYGQPSKILNGYNNEQVSQGYSNMTSFVQFVMNEYNYLMISRLPSLDRTMRELHWHTVVQRIYLTACDRIRLLMSQWFRPEPIVPRMMNEYSVELFDQRHESGRGLLDALVRHYTPWLRWGKQREMADSVETDDWGSARFQTYGLPYGICGHLLWNQRFMTLVETMLHVCRQYALKFCSRFMHRSFVDTVVEEAGRLHVKRSPDSARVEQDGRLWNSTLDIPASDRRFIDLLVQYFRDHREGRAPSYEWMAPIFGLSFYPLMMLRLSEHYYELEVFRQASVNVLAAMIDTHPREFFYIQYLMQQIARARNVQCYPLPVNIARQQAQALRDRFESMTGFRAAGAGADDLPYLWDITYYCEQHLDVKHCLVDDHPHRGTQAGVINVVTDPTSGRLWCSTNLLKANRTPKPDPRVWIRKAGVVFGRQNERLRLDDRGLSEDGDPEKDMWEGWRVDPPAAASEAPTPAKKTAQTAAGNNNSDEVRSVFALYADKTERLNCQTNRHVRAVHLCGQALRLGARTYVLCPRCAGLTWLQPEKFNNAHHGFLCPSCHDECAKAHAPSPPPQGAKTISSTAAPAPGLFHCYLCPYDRWVPAQRVHRLLMLDDVHGEDPDRARFRWTYFCDRHLPPWAGSSAMAVRLSTVSLVAAKRITAFPAQPPDSGPKYTVAKQWIFITNRSDARFWKSFEKTSRRIARIQERMPQIAAEEEDET